MTTTVKSDKWNSLRILIQWLEQGRILEIDDVKYGISEHGNIIRMFTEENGVELPSMYHIWKLVESIPFDKLFIMSSEVALTKMNQESAEKRTISNSARTQYTIEHYEKFNNEKGEILSVHKERNDCADIQVGDIVKLDVGKYEVMELEHMYGMKGSVSQNVLLLIKLLTI